MKPIVNFFIHLFSDSNKAQLQNVCGFLTVISLLAIAFINQLWGKEVSDFIYESLVALAVSCLGVAAISLYRGGVKDIKKEDADVPNT